MSAVTIQRAAGRGHLLRGGAALGVSVLLANAGNYAVSVLLARWLLPGQFADANLIVSLMLSITSVAVCLQFVCARFVAGMDAVGDRELADALFARLSRCAAGAGVLAGLLLILFAPQWQALFSQGSPWPFVVLGIGMPCYLVQAVGRGRMQGRFEFVPLASTFVVEMLVRLAATAGLVALGTGVEGAAVGLSASFFATWATVRLLGGGLVQPTQLRLSEVAGLRRYSLTMGALLLGQVVINNSDVFIAKATLGAGQAATYAVVALAGRATFFLTGSIATVLVPAASRRAAIGDDAAGPLRAGVAAIVAIGLGCSLAAFCLGDQVLPFSLGPEYGGLAAMLAAYVAVTTLFSACNLVASYSLSAGTERHTWVLLGASVLQVVLLLEHHGSGNQLIQSQGVTMIVLTTVLAVLGWRSTRIPRSLVTS